MRAVRPGLRTAARLTAPKRNYAQRRTTIPIPPNKARAPLKHDTTQAAPNNTFNARYGHTRKLPFYGMCAMALAISFYCSSIYMSYRKQVANGPKDVPADVTDRWDSEAETFDKDVERMEWWIGLDKLRKKLLKPLEGHVLEASAGTGRNTPYYNMKNIESVVMVDQSIAMIQIARERWRREQPVYLDKVTFRHQSVIDPVVLPTPDGFDSVVQTMGLCSTPDPVGLLKSLDNMTKTGGRILLLEHGLSHYDWLNTALDNTAPAHADKHGCWWNKDIGKIVEESGLEIVNAERYNFGTTWWFELKASDKSKGSVAEQVVQEATENSPPSNGASVSTWWNWALGR